VGGGRAKRRPIGGGHSTQFLKLEINVACSRLAPDFLDRKKKVFNMLNSVSGQELTSCVEPVSHEDRYWIVRASSKLPKWNTLESFTARSVENETRNAELNGNRNLE